MTAAPDPSKATKIMTLEAERQRETTKLNLATARMAWTDAKVASTRLVEIEAELDAIRTRPDETNIHGTYKARG